MNACSRIQNFANNSEIENSRNKDHAKISESTVLMGPVFGVSELQRLARILKFSMWQL